MNSNIIKIRFKIKDIEFEAEGFPEDVSRQRDRFVDDIVPKLTKGPEEESSQQDSKEIYRLEEHRIIS